MAETELAQSPEVATQAVETHEKKSPQESFAELRKAKDDAERQAWQAKKELELMQKQLESQRQPQALPQEDDFDLNQLAKEEFPSGEKLLKAFGKFDKKLSSYEKKLAEKEIKIQALEFAVDNPDFKDVVTAENIEKYIKSDEDNQAAVNGASNPLRTVYRLIKKDARYIQDQQAKAKPVSQEQKKVEEKETKPKTQSMGVRSEAVSTAAFVSNSKMSKEQRMALWKDTQAAARR